MRLPTSRLTKLGRALAVATLALGVFAAPAAGAIAPDSPHSPNADTIHTAYWVMLVVTLLLGAGLLGGLAAAAVRFRSTGPGAEPRRLTAGRGVVGRIAAGFGVVAVAIFIFGVVTTGDAREVEADEQAEELNIDVVGQQWLWRFEYPESQSETIATVFSYNELVVPVDTTVNLAINSTDVIHRWSIPALGGQVDAVPGEITRTSFRADEEGVYQGRSTQFSGTGYPAMRATVRVVSAAEYEEHLSQLEDDLAAGQAAVRDANATTADEEGE